MEILLGTKNKHKIIEMTRILQEAFKDSELIIKSLNDFPSVDEPVEDGQTFEENSVIKAKYYYDCFNVATITDDSGISVRYLNGEPGIYSARYASANDENSSDKDNRVKLLQNMSGVIDRYAYYTCAITYYDGENTIVETGYTEGYLLEEEIGTNGFGYDCIFYSTEIDKPLGIASDEEKDKISHRAKALNNLVKTMSCQLSTKL